MESVEYSFSDLFCRSGSYGPLVPGSARPHIGGNKEAPPTFLNFIGVF